MAQNTNKGPTDKGILIACALCAVIGALIGFGTQGTLQGVCLGAGIGASAPLFILLL